MSARRSSPLNWLISTARFAMDSVWHAAADGDSATIGSSPSLCSNASYLEDEPVGVSGFEPVLWQEGEGVDFDFEFGPEELLADAAGAGGVGLFQQLFADGGYFAVAL